MSESGFAECLATELRPGYVARIWTKLPAGWVFSYRRITRVELKPGMPGEDRILVSYEIEPDLTPDLLVCRLDDRLSITTESISQAQEQATPSTRIGKVQGWELRLPSVPERNDRRLLKLVREPGADAVLTIDGKPCRIVRLKVTPDVTEVLFEQQEDSQPDNDAVPPAPAGSLYDHLGGPR